MREWTSRLGRNLCTKLGTDPMWKAIDPLGDKDNLLDVRHGSLKCSDIRNVLPVLVQDAEGMALVFARSWITSSIHRLLLSSQTHTFIVSATTACLLRRFPRIAVFFAKQTPSLQISLAYLLYIVLHHWSVTYKHQRRKPKALTALSVRIFCNDLALYGLPRTSPTADIPGTNVEVPIQHSLTLLSFEKICPFWNPS
ncbi:uncharacterized protein BDR25DRAFT_355201 [Lindgomyces ingoldianus]|uniref:Uncharacterized protein n=1 Tax=Lindgomyces ingoldianus TaxID=673940 RepID=A0ACB6QUQ8_9PLEO|nr:uncharacterized protein BDR25DRAFT_355201 [Lindgomyces ingoldianus]KAF2470743.1 hypothetical protein BDR25DRAFT_355201 [Lindgomyces ingoldianus]